MALSNRILAGVLVLAALAAGPAAAGIPNPEFSSIPNVVMSPGGTLPYVVTIGSAQGPVADAIVQIVFSSEADGLVCWCTGQTHPVITATTDASGQATFFIAAGGCIDPSLVATPPAVEVYANGILLAERGAVSSDAVDNAGLLPTSGWTPGGLCAVGLSDATFHSPAVKTGTYTFCTDINSDGFVDLTDATILTVDIKSGASCVQE